MAFPPQRIICLTEETVETLYLFGEEDRIVGVSGYAVRPPQVRREKPRVSAFISADIPKILELKPDLVLTFSDIQADIVAGLVRAGVEVHAFNQRTIAGIFDMIRTLAALVGATAKGELLVAALSARLDSIKAKARQRYTRPRVYFEEWDQPIISGIGWVSELVEIAGGIDVCAHLADRKAAKDRILTPEDVIAAQPDIVIGSWCGKKFRPDKFAARTGYEAITAVRNNQLFEIKSPLILQPGPAALTDGVDAIVRIIDNWYSRSPALDDAKISRKPSGRIEQPSSAPRRQGACDMSAVASHVPTETMKITKLKEQIGAIVTGVDLAAPVDAATRKRLYDAAVENVVLVIRGQSHLTPAQLQAAGELFGELMEDQNRRYLVDGFPLISVLDNRHKDSKGQPAKMAGNATWHTDHTNQERPPKFTMLYAVAVPEKGGETSVCNSRAAYKALPEDLKRKIDGMKTENTLISSALQERQSGHCEGSARIDEATDHSPACAYASRYGHQGGLVPQKQDRNGHGADARGDAGLPAGSHGQDHTAAVLLRSPV